MVELALHKSVFRKFKKEMEPEKVLRGKKKKKKKDCYRTVTSTILWMKTQMVWYGMGAAAVRHILSTYTPGENPK